MLRVGGFLGDMLVGRRSARSAGDLGGGVEPRAVCRDEYNAGTGTGNCHFFHRGAYQPPNWISVWRPLSTGVTSRPDLTGGSLKPVDAFADRHQWIRRV